MSGELGPGRAGWRGSAEPLLICGLGADVSACSLEGWRSGHECCQNSITGVPGHIFLGHRHRLLLKIYSVVE